MAYPSAEVVFNELFEKRDSFDKIPVREGHGVYALFTDNPNIFSGDPEGLPDIKLRSIQPECWLVYIGEGEDLPQRRRDLLNEKSGGPHSGRRSIGAILKNKLKLGMRASKSKNFKFNPPSEECLSDWMHANLQYSIYRIPGDRDVFEAEREDLETELIGKYEPPLNLDKWSPTGQEKKQRKDIKARRKACLQEAQGG